MLAAFPSYAEETLGIGNTVIVQGAMACAGLGIMLGSVVCGRLSRRHIETGVIPLGAAGIALCLFILPYLGNAWLQALNFLIWGLFGGLLIIPLNALIQFHAGEHEAGRVLAGSNFLQNGMMLAFLGLTVVFALYGMDSLGLFAILLLVAIAATVYIAGKLPQSLIRLIVSAMARRHYRLRVRGLEHMPETGAVWLVGARGNPIDYALLQMASPRPIRFIVPGHLLAGRRLKWLAALFKAIPAHPGKEAREAIHAGLGRGDVVCLYAAGTAGQGENPTGFQDDIKTPNDKTNAVLLPFAIHDPGERRAISVAFGRPLALAARARAEGG